MADKLATIFGTEEDKYIYAIYKYYLGLIVHFITKLVLADMETVVLVYIIDHNIVQLS